MTTVEGAKPRRWKRSDIIAVGSLGVAILSLLVAAGAFSSAQASIQRRTDLDRTREDSIAGALTGQSELDVLHGLTSVSKSSDAYAYLTAISQIWAAEYDATSLPALIERGTFTRQGDVYDLCYAKAKTMPERCVELGAFVHDADSGLVTRFSIDGIPVDELVIASDSSDALGGENGLDVIATRRSSVRSASGTRLCTTYTIEDGRTEWTSSRLHFQRDEWEIHYLDFRKTAEGSVAWPDTIGVFEKKAGAACIESDNGGFVRVSAHLGKDSATLSGWLRT